MQIEDTTATPAPRASDSSSYTRHPPRTFDALTRLARATVNSGRRLFVVTDFDSTVSTEARDGTNPFVTGFDEQAGRALGALQAHGQLVGILSNRAAGQIAIRWQRLALGQLPLTVGTYGYELAVPDAPSVIDARFAPWRAAITDALSAARQTLLSAYALGAVTGDVIEQTIKTRYGPVYLERKGVTDDYPEGLAQEYNFNACSPAGRTEMVNTLEASVRSTLAPLNPDLVHALEQLWGAERAGEPSQPGRCSWGLEPRLARGKAHGLTLLLRAVKHTQPSSWPPALLIYLGDHEQQDGQVMWAGKLLERATCGAMRFVGVWADPTSDLPDVPDQSDLHVAGVRVVAELLGRLSD